MSERVTATFYVQLQAERYNYGAAPSRVHGAKAVRITQARPDQPLPDTKVVKMRVTLPVEAFENLPIVDVHIPLEDLTEVEGEVAVA